MTAEPPVRIVARASWRCLWRPGTDAAALAALPDGWRLTGRAEMALPEGPASFHYRVECTAAWEPRTAEIALRTSSKDRRIAIRVDERGRWSLGHRGKPNLRGCTDLDLAATPATNTLALNRLGLPARGTREILAAWITFPALEAHAVPQRYTRLSERRYRYENLHTGYTTAFEVDAAGFVTRYPESWERIAPANGAAPAAGRTRARSPT